MNRRNAVVATAVALLAVVAPASATTITLDMDVTRDAEHSGLIGPQPDGSIVYGMERATFFSQTFRAKVNADDNGPVTGCLDGGAQVQLVDQAGVVRATTTCASAAGTFDMLPVGTLRIDRPTTLVARIAGPTSTTGATGVRPISPADSNRVIMRVEPRLADESPASVRGNRFPIKARLLVPSPRPQAGKIVLQRRQGSRWVTVVSKKPNAAGIFNHTVTLVATRTAFRVVFNPTAGSGWLQTGYSFSITRRRI
jgi:hypothetical protein